jgi:uncharacterized membrane protein (DUF373 family)
MLLFITLGIIIGAAHLFQRLGDLLPWEDNTRHYVRIVSDVLTLFILVELARSLADYFTAHRLRLALIVDAGIVFVLREIMIKLFEEKIGATEIFALAALVAVLGALRIGSVLVFEREQTMIEQLAKGAAGSPGATPNRAKNSIGESPLETKS